MHRKAEISPWCVASVFLALTVVAFLLVHPLNCVSSGCSPLASFATFLLGF
jgi:hypothetical protein